MKTTLKRLQSRIKPFNESLIFTEICKFSVKFCTDSDHQKSRKPLYLLCFSIAKHNKIDGIHESQQPSYNPCIASLLLYVPILHRQHQKPLEAILSGSMACCACSRPCTRSLSFPSFLYPFLFQSFVFRIIHSSNESFITCIIYVVSLAIP